MSRVLIASACVVLFTSSSAFAERSRGGGGRLGRVGSGIRSGSGGGGSSSSGSSSGGYSGYSGGHSGYSGGHSGYSSGHGSYGHNSIGGHALAFPSLSVSGDVYAGAQKLVESDRAFSFDGRLLFNDFGVAARYTQFQERDPVMSSTLKLDLWSVAATYRFRVTKDLELSPELGGAGLVFRGDGMAPVSESGVMGGLSMRYRVASQVALVGEARLFQMSGAGSAIEGRAGVAVGPLQLSYRRVTFVDAGPPLEGPEVGLRFRF